MSQIVRSKTDLKEVIRGIKKKNSSIGLVPTMGALHQGHLSLVQMSKIQYDVTVVTIFVNPAQFNNSEDLDKYPRTEKEDIELLKKEGVDIIFIPNAAEIYSIEPILNLSFGYLETIMEGKQRPGHFNGVGLIVMKFFGLVEPDGAYFGQKDLQQFKIISALVNDFDLTISLHMAPIVRESSGLAMSSRNQRLNEKQRILASKIYKALRSAEKKLKAGEEVELIKKNLDGLLTDSSIKLEYFEIVRYETLQSISIVNEGDRLALCIAANMEQIRLIDNIIIEI
jgi:pantoate--beta-alanine ligase